MGNLNIQQLLNDMLAAFKTTVAGDWSSMHVAVQQELKTIAQSFVEIQKMQSAHQINQEQAKLMIAEEKDRTKAALLTLEGLSELTVQNGLNAALNAIKDTVNKAIGFTLL